MRMIGNMSRATMPASARLPCIAALLSLVVGCSSIPPSRVEPPPAVPEPPRATPEPSVDSTRGEFTVPVSMLDAWNAVGQILIRVDGVDYEGRAQMLGIYVVRYRGERFLIVTRALVMTEDANGMVTRVSAVLPDGKSNDSEAAIELLRILRERLPAELAFIAAGGRKKK
ncbi:MAG: hypothetical protein ACREPE_00720 [Lysobacter sp.]